MGLTELRTAAGRALTVTVNVSTEYRTPEGVIANWRKLTKDQLIDNLCVYHEGLAQLSAEAEAEAAELAGRLDAERLAEALQEAEIGCLGWGGFHDGNEPKVHHLRDANRILAAYRQSVVIPAGQDETPRTGEHSS